METSREVLLFCQLRRPTHGSNEQKLYPTRFTDQLEAAIDTQQYLRSYLSAGDLLPHLLSPYRLSRHFLFLQHLPCWVSIRKLSTLKSEYSRTTPDALNTKRNAAAAMVTAISSPNRWTPPFAKREGCCHRDPGCRAGPGPPELRREPRDPRRTRPPGEAPLQGSRPEKRYPRPAGSPSPRGSETARASGGLKRIANPRASRGRARAPRQGPVPTPRPRRVAVATEPFWARQCPRAGGAGRRWRRRRCGGGAGRWARDTAWRVTSDAPGPAVELERVVQHAGHQARSAGGLGGGGTHGEQQQQRRSRQTCPRCLRPCLCAGAAAAAALLQPGMWFKSLSLGIFPLDSASLPSPAPVPRGQGGGRGGGGGREGGGGGAARRPRSIGPCAQAHGGPRLRGAGAGLGRLAASCLAFLFLSLIDRFFNWSEE